VATLRQQLLRRDTREIQEGKKRAREEFEDLKEKVRQLENWSKKMTILGKIIVEKKFSFCCMLSLLMKDCKQFYRTHMNVDYSVLGTGTHRTHER